MRALLPVILIIATLVLAPRVNRAVRIDIITGSNDTITVTNQAAWEPATPQPLVVEHAITEAPGVLDRLLEL